MAFFFGKIIKEYRKTSLPFKISIMLILFIRIILFALPSFRIDMSAWQSWAARLVQAGPMNFYDTNIWTNYTPGYLIFLWIIGLLSNGVFNISFFSSTFIFIIKFTTTIFDIATAILIFKILKGHGNNFLPVLGFIFYFGNPAIIFNTSIWGQIDGMLTFFMFFSIYLFLEKKKYLSSSLSLTQSFFIKPQAISLFPIYIVAILKQIKLGKILQFILAGLILIFIYSLLFFPQNILFGLLKLVFKMAKDYPFTSLYAFNIWGILGWWQNDAIRWMGLSYSLWGLTMYIVGLSLVVVPSLMRQNRDKSYTYLLYSLSIIVFYLFPTRVHERYLLPFFAFFLVAAFLRKSTLLLLIYMIITVINFINLWFVYYYYDFVYGNPLVQENPFYRLIEHNHTLLSAVLILCFFIILFFYYRLKFYVKKQ